MAKLGQSIFLLSLLCSSGCAAQKHIKPTTVSVPTKCVTSLSVTDKTECTVWSDGKLRCSNVEIKYIPGCEQIAVKENK